MGNSNFSQFLDENLTILTAKLQILENPDGNDAISTLYEYYQLNQNQNENNKMTKHIPNCLANCLASLGILANSNSGDKIVQIVLDQLLAEALQNSEQNCDQLEASYSDEIILFQAWLLKSDKTKVKRHLQKACHLFPEKAEFWVYLSKVLDDDDDKNDKNETKLNCLQIARHLENGIEMDYYLKLLPKGITNKKVQKEIML